MAVLDEKGISAYPANGNVAAERINGS